MNTIHDDYEAMDEHSISVLSDRNGYLAENEQHTWQTNGQEYLAPILNSDASVFVEETQYSEIQ